MELTENVGIVAKSVPLFPILNVFIGHSSSDVKSQEMVHQFVGPLIILVHVNAHPIEHSDRVFPPLAWSTIAFNHRDFWVVFSIGNLIKLEKLKEGL